MARVRRAVVRDEPGRLPRHRHRRQGRHARGHGPARHGATRARLLGRGARPRRRRSTRSTTRSHVDGRLGARHRRFRCSSSARPLWNLGGYRLALLLPMAGAVGAAFAGRSLARRSAGDGGGLVGLLGRRARSPMAHLRPRLLGALAGRGLHRAARWRCWRVVDGAPASARALGAGALLGVAATMRTEALVYALVAVGRGRPDAAAPATAVGRRRPPGRARRRGLRRPVGRQPRARRRWLGGHLAGPTGPRRAAAGAAAGESSDRGREAIVTLLALRPGGRRRGAARGSGGRARRRGIDRARSSRCSGRAARVAARGWRSCST